MLTKWKKKIKIALIILIVVLLLFSLISVKINLDVGNILMGAALLVVAFTFYAMYEYAARPKKQIHIINKVSLSSPPMLLKPFVNYKLHISSKYEIENKGETREVNLDEIDFSFNKSDHPQVYEYCMGIINAHIQKNLELVQKKHPDAILLDTETQLPQEVWELKEKNED